MPPASNRIATGKSGKPSIIYHTLRERLSFRPRDVKTFRHPFLGLTILRDFDPSEHGIGPLVPSPNVELSKSSGSAFSDGLPHCMVADHDQKGARTPTELSLGGTRKLWPPPPNLTGSASRPEPRSGTKAPPLGGLGDRPRSVRSSRLVVGRIRFFRPALGCAFLSLG